MAGSDDLSDLDYRRLLTLRTRLRGFIHWSEAQAKQAGLSPAQHQLLLAVRGHDHPAGPTIGELADYLYVRHHSAVGLVRRCDATGLVTRFPDDLDGRVVRVRLTARGHQALRDLSRLHMEELRRLASHLQPLLAGLDVGQADHGGSKPAA
ncbi:MAG TPA: MarR family winged helix-turn-helix transcriptional regulator [Acidimicrobiales bacterium]|nr:MarR family winged helix-turn-helix transcriptional regulator [Acidimicrobiales bacterium]